MRFLVLLLWPLSLSAQATVTLNGSTYTLRTHPRVWLDGSSGTLATALQNTGDRSQSANPAYAALTSVANAYVAANYCSTGANTYSGYQCHFSGNPNAYTWVQATDAAFLWWAQGANPADPNGYLAAAKYAINHIEDLDGVTTACDETQTYCGRQNSQYFTNVAIYEYLWTTYSIIRSQLTAGEITTFANKVLNDNGSDHNGLNPMGSPCTKRTFTAGAGTITYSGSSNVVTGSGTSFTTAFSVGDVITSQYYAIGVVYSITSNTQLVLTANAFISGTAQTYSQSAAWQTGDCGILWNYKHGQFAPPVFGQPSNYQTDYPTTGGTTISYDHNLPTDSLYFYIEIGLALADDDSRAGTLLTDAYNYYYAHHYPLLKSGWTGVTQGGEVYTTGIWFDAVAGIAISIKNSVISGPDLASGLYISRMPQYTYYLSLPVGGGAYHTWGDVFNNPQNIASLFGGLGACFINFSTECQSLYNFVKTVRGDYTSAGWAYDSGTYLPWLYTFWDYNGTSSAPGPPQYVFKDPDLTYSQCSSQFGAPACIQNQVWQDAISNSDWTTTATQVLMQAGWDEAGQDHTDNVQQGAFHVYRNAYLLAGDTSSANGTYGYGTVTGNMIDLNNTAVTTGSFAPFSRWAGADPTGDPSGRYAYAMIDLTTTYSGASNATRVQRHIAHFKKASGQDYVVVYDDIALSAAISVAPKSYFHYFLNSIAPATAISYSGVGLTVSNTQASSKLNSAFIPVGGSNSAALVVDNANGTYTGGNGFTFRAYMCPSSNGTTCDAAKTSGEWVGVFEPINATTGSMPTITQLTSTSFRTVQIADATAPKVASFAEGGTTYGALSFTSTFTGTGQYLIAGMSPGTYAVKVGGAPVSGSPFTVASGDNTIYFEAASGVVAVTSTMGSAISGGVTLNGGVVIH